MTNGVINSARDFAMKAHAGQLYGKLPYVDHLDYVAYYVELFDGDDELIAAAYLHDVLEDTNIAHSELVSLFGKGIADLVLAVTCPKFAARKERMQASLREIRTVGERAVFLKLCDRLANVMTSMENGPPAKYAMYKGEQPMLEEILHRPGEHTAVWALLRKAFESK